MGAGSTGIEIVPYDSGWTLQFEAEAARIRAALGATALRIDHNGSTSIPGMRAKPVIDIQISVAKLQPLATFGDPLETIGYHHVPHPDDAFCPFFHRPADWPHTHHVHVVEHGGIEERRTLAFRDYLRDHDITPPPTSMDNLVSDATASEVKNVAPSPPKTNGCHFAPARPNR